MLEGLDIVSLEELAIHEDRHVTDITTFLRIERKDEHDSPATHGLTIAWDHYSLDIITSDGKEVRNYTLHHELLNVSLFAAWPKGIECYEMRDDGFYQEPMDLHLRPINDKVADFLMQSQFRAAIQGMIDIFAIRPAAFTARINGRWQTYRFPSDQQSLNRIEEEEQQYGHHGNAGITVYYTCPKGLEKFFTSASSSSLQP